MLKLAIKFILLGVAIYFLAGWLPGVHVSSLGSGIALAVVLALLNALVRPVLTLLTLPITLLTLGLFLLVVNGCIIYMADAFLTGFSVDSFLYAIVFSVVLSVVHSVVDSALQ